jgi:hypothetical protein
LFYVKGEFERGIVQIVGKFGPALFIPPKGTPPCPWWLGQEAGHNLGEVFQI